MQKEPSLAQQYGSVKLVDVHGTDPNNSKEFQECIPEHNHCTQIIHGMACGDLQDALYVVASLRTLIRVVHMHLHEDAKDSYRLALQEVYERNLTWIPTGKFAACLERCTLPRYACDADTIGGALSLWTAIAYLACKGTRQAVAGRTNVDPNNTGHVEPEQGSN